MTIDLEEASGEAGRRRRVTVACWSRQQVPRSAVNAAAKTAGNGEVPSRRPPGQRCRREAERHANVPEMTSRRVEFRRTRDERASSELPRDRVGRFVFGPVAGRVVEEILTISIDWRHGEMEDSEPPPESLDLTAEQMVETDMAMLLDMGRAEELADLMARQALRPDIVADATERSSEREERP